MAGFSKDRLNEFYKAVIEEYFMKKGGMSYLKLLAISRFIFRLYPPKFKILLEGMSESSGISLKKLIMLDQVNVFEYMRNQNIGRCSNIAVWGDYTEDGTLIFGRNFDQPEYFKRFNEFMTLVVYNPGSEEIPTASIGYAGQVGVNAAMNRYGVFIANNEAPVLEDDRIDMNTPSVLAVELELLMNVSDLDGMNRRMSRSKTNCPIIVSACDAKRASAYEWTTSRLKSRSEKEDGLMVATNHFVDPSWKREEPIPDIAEKTVERRRNLLSFARNHRGRFNVQKMLDLLDITVDKGGATHSDKTTFQVVTIPEKLKFIVKIPGFQDWTEINLKGLLDSHAINIGQGRRCL
ncbi:MAG: C45 family autoproteolytic acyltransferase/hydrolase [Candidatus Omnitrophica bacterium]|nr:C45 family autoproteolytic acyltransferase/hydrolase [Candidatus Omnitrophota bacterium]